jgi:glycolate oxidase iron-sulfur subunit
VQINLVHNFVDKNTQDATDIIKKCVHCGFCLATCPTYLVLGDEANSPRGRIYNIKNFLEGGKLDIKSLDKCLICRACESTCPSGVEYHKLLEVGKGVAKTKRSFMQKTMRKSLAKFLTTPILFNSGAWLVGKKPKIKVQNISGKKQVILHNGCVQKALYQDINNATQKVLNKLGFEVINTKQNECCSAIDMHLDNTQNGIKQIKNNIDNWFDILQNGATNIVSNASGCGLMIKDCPEVLKNDKNYYEKAVFIAEKTQDITEFLMDKDLSIMQIEPSKARLTKIKYHEPCTLQHGQKLAGKTHEILNKLGFEVEVINDNHLCCGSAGTYSIFQPKIANTLRDNKLKNLAEADIIVSSNIGCIMHLQKGTKIPVKHWVELLV